MARIDGLVIDDVHFENKIYCYNVLKVLNGNILLAGVDFAPFWTVSSRRNCCSAGITENAGGQN